MTEFPAVWVVGLGAISAIGDRVAECREALESGTSGIGVMRRLPSVHRMELPVAEVPWTNDELAQRSGLDPRSSRTALLSALAAREALEDAGLIPGEVSRIGFISANTVGGMDRTEDFFPAFRQNPGRGRLRDVVQHECGTVTEVVAELLGIRHHQSTVSTACSSSANSIFFAARLIQHGRLDAALAGGSDSLSRFTLNGFNTLMILDSEPCRPFDESRRGLNLGEGAGYLLLVSDALRNKLQLKPYCRLSGYANANDAYHQTASSPEGKGSLLAMGGALRRAGLTPSDIGYINLHGTGTLNNDLSEGRAIQQLFAPNYPSMSSTKSFTGHTLGASGGIEAVFSALSARDGLIYPNLRFSQPMKELDFIPDIKFRKDPSIRHVLSNSFGFGGNCSSLIFSKS
jgi:3-oxoacyl-[acyl-carrier-protein] synthase-1